MIVIFTSKCYILKKIDTEKMKIALIIIPPLQRMEYTGISLSVIHFYAIFFSSLSHAHNFIQIFSEELLIIYVASSSS